MGIITDFLELAIILELYVKTTKQEVTALNDVQNCNYSKVTCGTHLNFLSLTEKQTKP